MINLEQVFYTKTGTPYFKEPWVQVISWPNFNKENLREYIESFDPDLGYNDYLEDCWGQYRITPGESVAKFSGQNCYRSFSEKRTRNDSKEKYFKHILESGHGSILEGVNYGILIWGIDRSVSHELIRHKAGTSVSQTSQRYVDELRFVERLTFQQDEVLHEMFEDRIDNTCLTYYDLQDRLFDLYKGMKIPKTELTKKVNQDARAVLSNETETSLVFTANIRAWRNILEQRASKYADVEIRRLANKLYEALVQEEPLFFGDYTKEVLEDGTFSLDTPYRKV